MKLTSVRSVTPTDLLTNLVAGPNTSRFRITFIKQAAAPTFSITPNADQFGTLVFDVTSVPPYVSFDIDEFGSVVTGTWFLTYNGPLPATPLLIIETMIEPKLEDYSSDNSKLSDRNNSGNRLTVPDEERKKERIPAKLQQCQSLHDFLHRFRNFRSGN